MRRNEMEQLRAGRLGQDLAQLWLVDREAALERMGQLVDAGEEAALADALSRAGPLAGRLREEIDLVASEMGLETDEDDPAKAVLWGIPVIGRGLATLDPAAMAQTLADAGLVGENVELLPAARPTTADAVRRLGLCGILERLAGLVLAADEGDLPAPDAGDGVGLAIVWGAMVGTNHGPDDPDALLLPEPAPTQTGDVAAWLDRARRLHPGVLVLGMPVRLPQAVADGLTLLQQMTLEILLDRAQGATAARVASHAAGLRIRLEAQDRQVLVTHEMADPEGLIDVEDVARALAGRGLAVIWDPGFEFSV